MNDNVKAFLCMLAVSEIGTALLAVSDDGYNVLVGSTPEHPLLFHDYADHPNIYNKATNSTAAGRYQLLHRYWLSYQPLLRLSDYGHDSQDAVAIQQIKESNALAFVESGQFESAVLKCAHIWASLPGAVYGQHTNKIDDLRVAYQNAGGTFA